MKQLFLSILLMLVPVLASALTVEVNGITYNLYSTDRDVAYVTKSNTKYSGDIVIPPSINYNGSIYSVESIEQLAFENCSDLTSVSIPNSIKFIGSNAFHYCTSLTSIIIPNSVTQIETYAFGECSGLTSITLSNNLESITEGTFYNCSGLSSIIIPDGVTKIVGYAFQGCSNLTSITIPNTVTSIGSYAFSNCRSLTSLSLPNSVTTINDYAFENCSNLLSITITNNITSMSNNCLYNCSNDLFFNVRVTNLSDFCNNTIVKFVRNWFSKPIRLIDNEGNEIKDYIIPNDVTTIGDYAFYNCIGLNSITIPSSVTSIGIGTFAGCKELTKIIFQCNLLSVGSEPFGNCSNLKEVIFDCETAISLFKGFSSISTVTFTEKVTSIAERAFYNCSGITSLIIPENLKDLGKECFLGCSGLSSLSIPSSVTTINDGVFYGCSNLTSIIIPNSVTEIGRWSFQNCTNLSSIVIGSGVTKIGDDAFDNTNLKKTIWLTNTPPKGYSYAKGAVNYVSNDQFSNLQNVVKYQFLSSYFDVDGIRYVPISPSERTCDAIDCVYNESAENTRISSTAVYKGVTMTVKNIQPYLAYNNIFIKTLNIDNDGELSVYAFTNCSNIEKVTLGSKVSSIGASAFEGCSSIEEIDIPEIVTILNPMTFKNCKSLKAIKIKPMLTEITSNVFNNCTSLEKVIIEDSEEELKLGSNGNSPLFSSCPLDSVYIGRNINYETSQSYGYSPFYRNTSLRAVKITDKETEISANEFYGCSNLQRVSIGDGVTTIGDWAFSGCSSLKYFAFGSQVQNIGKEAFSDCVAVSEIISKAATAPVCGAQALDDINKWDCKLYVPDGCLAAYQQTDQWKDFFFSEEGQGTAEQGGEEENKGKCEPPTISLKGGMIVFDSKTKGAIFHYSITHSDVKNDITNGVVGLTNTYTISVYASKEKYENSDTVTAEIQVKGGGGDLNNDGLINASDVVKLVNIIMNKE